MLHRVITDARIAVIKGTDPLSALRLRFPAKDVTCQFPAAWEELGQFCVEAPPVN